jgi:UDPglucose 6-dehydrogenase
MDAQLIEQNHIDFFKKLVKKQRFKIYDMRNMYSPSRMKKLNIDYYGVGR